MTSVHSAALGSGYSHTQHGRLHYVVLAVAIVYALTAVLLRDWPGVSLILAAVAGVLAILAGMFTRLTVRDESDCLAIRFGRLPGFRKRLPYARMRFACVGHTRWIDGWGIHWMPGRGWTYNLWGSDCAKVVVGGRTVRIGTDDPHGLVAFLNHRMRVQARLEEPRAGA